MRVAKARVMLSGVAKGGFRRRAIAQQLKSDPWWIQATNNYASTNIWMQKMYPHVSAGGTSAEFTREVWQGGPAWDKVAAMHTCQESGSCEELNKPGFSVIRHALRDLTEDLDTPIPMLNPVLKKGLQQVQKRVAALETLDVGGPNVPRGVAELQMPGIS